MLDFLLAEKLDIPGQITPVCIEGVLGQTAFDGQVVQEMIEVDVHMFKSVNCDL